MQATLRGAWWVALGLAVVAFVGLTLLVISNGGRHFDADLAFTRALQSLHSPTLDRIAEIITWPGFPPQSNVFFAALAGTIWLTTRRFLAAVMEVVAAAGSAALWFAITPLVARPRPSPDLVNVSFPIDYGSYPSGHVLNFTAGLGFAAYLLLVSGRPGWWRWLLVALVAVYLLLLGLARVYTGQHWLTDVLGGYLLGSVWLGITVGLYAAGEARLGRGKGAQAEPHSAAREPRVEQQPVGADHS